MALPRRVDEAQVSTAQLGDALKAVVGLHFDDPNIVRISSSPREGAVFAHAHQPYEHGGRPIMLGHRALSAGYGLSSFVSMGRETKQPVDQ
ncbi:MAG TPA: hypothetical protein VHJ20_10375 [Polyangia bacterium]|nr:hypothetical protein [Polyangia bacterium]